jgi:glycosyltransferase involved in cell wall biosynthesis
MTKAKDLGVADRTHFLGQQKEPLHIVAGLDLFVLPSRSEGFSNALLEAAFLGVPCIATDVGAAREILGVEGLLFQPGDFEAVCRHALHCLADLDASRLAARRIQARVKEVFASGRMASHWLSLYNGTSSRGVSTSASRSDPVALLS